METTGDTFTVHEYTIILTEKNIALQAPKVQ